MHRSPPGGARRGAVLLITVLICLFAATIAMLMLRQSLVGMAAAKRDLSYAHTQAQTAALRSATETTLLTGPYTFLATVLAGEPDRQCATTAPATVVAAGAPWDCGTTWTYPSLPTTGTWIEVVAPTRTNPALRITYRSADPATAETISYLPNQAGVFSAQSTAGALDLATFGPGATLTGGFYAAGDLTVPATTTLTAATTLATGTDVQGPASAANVYTPNTTPALSSLATPSGPAVLTTTVDALHETGCPDYDPVNVAGAPSHLCLAPGKRILTTAGSLATLPAGAAAVLLTTEPSGTALQVRYTTTAPDVAIHDTSPVPNVHSDTANRVAQKRYGGQLDSWTVLGAVSIPTSGIVATSLPTWLGMCDARTPSSGFMNPSTGTCHITDLPEGTTVVAGTAAEPRDVWLSGPLNGARLSALTAGNVVLPWFSSTTSSLSAAHNQISLGAGAAITSYPTTAISTLTPVGYTGLAIAPHLSFSWAPFTNTSKFSPAQGMAANPPTWFPGTSTTWAPAASTLQ